MDVARQVPVDAGLPSEYAGGGAPGGRRLEPGLLPALPSGLLAEVLTAFGFPQGPQGLGATSVTLLPCPVLQDLTPSPPTTFLLALPPRLFLQRAPH